MTTLGKLRHKFLHVASFVALRPSKGACVSDLREIP